VQMLLQKIGEEWDDSLQSKEQIEAKLLHKQEAALRRERALAYSFSHQVARLPHWWFILFFYFGFLWNRENNNKSVDGSLIIHKIAHSICS